MTLTDERLAAAGITVRLSDDGTHAYLKTPQGHEVTVATDGDRLVFHPERSGGQRAIMALLG